MTIELGEKIAEGSNGAEKKGLKEFYPLKNLPAGHKIEGIYKGTFESKKKPGLFFHIFEDKNGDSFAYGTCKAFQDRIEVIKEKEKEVGGKVYAEITFNGRIKSKKSTNTYYSFSTPTIYSVKTNDIDVPF
jgi:hypothetical protein